jgi:hypothetical protein
MGKKEDELSTGRVWAAGFHHVTSPFSLGAYKMFIYLYSSLFFQAMVNRRYGISGYGGTTVFDYTI